MNSLKDQVQKAIDAKKNDVNTFIWKFEKKKLADDSFTQEKIRLIDASEEQLNSFYKHCKTMLYNTDSRKIGRYPLLDLIKEQRINCNAMLFINWVVLHGQNGNPYPRHIFFQDLNSFLELNSESLPRSTWTKTAITNIMPDIPVEFKSLSIQTVYDACLDTLGVFDKQHITNNFIIKMGLWFTQEEIKELTVKNESGKTINRLDVVRQRCELRPDTILYINRKGLTYKEFRAMKNLRSKRYSELTTDQLTILRDKILFKLEEEVRNHIQQWKERMTQIEKVCEIKGFILSND